jgi:hypothetical protein
LEALLADAGASPHGAVAATRGPYEMPTKGESEIIVEMRPVGGVVRVAAIDVATGTEVVIMGPASASPQTLEQVAVAKLRRKLTMDKGS